MVVIDRENTINDKKCYKDKRIQCLNFRAKRKN